MRLMHVEACGGLDMIVEVFPIAGPDADYLSLWFRPPLVGDRRTPLRSYVRSQCLASGIFGLTMHRLLLC